MAAKKPDDLVKELCKLKSNRNCFDCGKQGPHANVCTSFNIFVCQNCAGLHRKFTHKVKGISASTFTQKEVDELKAGGNKKAEKIWHATLEEKPHGLDLNVPSNLELFFKLVYVEMKWYRDPGTVVDKDKGEKKTGTLKKLAPTSQNGKPELPSPAAAAQQAGNGVKAFPAPEPSGKGTVQQQAKPQPDKTPDLISSFGSEFTFDAPTRNDSQPPLSPTSFLNSAVSSPAQVETITESSKNIAPNADVVETLTRGFKAIMEQYKLSGLALQACVEKALADIMGASVILTPSKFANEKKPQVQASVPPTPPNTNTITRHTSRLGAPPMSPGQGSLDISTLRGNTIAPLSQNGPSENGDLVDPLAGIGTSGDTSGNPFDDDTFGGSSPAQGGFLSNGSNGTTGNRNGAGAGSQRGGGGDIFDSPATFEQQASSNGLSNAFGGSTQQSSLNAGAFGNTAPVQNGASALTMSMRGGQAPVQQQTGFMQQQFPFDASAFGGQTMQVGPQMGGQMYGGVMQGYPQAGMMQQGGGMMQQGGMMPMGYPPGTMYMMPQGYVQAGAGFTTGTQQTPFGGQNTAPQQTTQTTAPQPKKPANDMFTQLNPLASKP